MVFKQFLTFLVKISKFLVFGYVLLTISLSFSTSIPTQAQSISDLNILGIKCVFPNQPGCTGGNIYDNTVGFMLGLAPVLAVLVIIWGGYRYFFGALTGQQGDGKKAIFAGVTGLVLVYASNIIVNLTRQTVRSDGTFNLVPLTEQIGTVSNFLSLVAGVIALLTIVWGGYKYMISALPGDQKNGRDTIQAGITGLVIVLIAQPIRLLIEGTLGGNTPTSTALTLSTTTVVTYVKNILTGFAIPVSVVFSVFFIVLGAYYYITGQDVEKGKKAITNAIIGLVITLLASTIAGLIIYIVPGINFG